MWIDHQSYVATYLERDLRSQLQVGNLRGFERFLRAGALRTSQLLNRADMARDVGISPSTAGQWLSALERSAVVSLLEPWFSNRGKALVKSPKLHFQDQSPAFLGDHLPLWKLLPHGQRHHRPPARRPGAVARMIRVHQW